jgi:hypothetical protein
MSSAQLHTLNFFLADMRDGRRPYRRQGRLQRGIPVSRQRGRRGADRICDHDAETLRRASKKSEPGT